MSDGGNGKIYQASRDELLQLIRDLCAIPAPSHREGKRAVFCRDWFEENGGKNVVIDEALLSSGSTDANIPLSMGIPAACISVCNGGKCHTREGWLDVGSLPDGCRLFMHLLASYL